MPCVFCDFISKKRKIHVNNSKFKILHEREHSISFISSDCPAHADGHTLVIPKTHFKNLESIPKLILHDLIDHVALIGKALKKEYKGYNVLLNNGRCAGQVIMHVHFHLIPRITGDKCEIEIFPRKIYSPKLFNQIHNKLKRLINSVLE